MIHTDAGYYTPVTPPSGTGDPSFMHIWYLKDHLGNNRVLADGSGNALKVHHYGPFGEQIAIQAGGSLTPFPAGSTESPYKYGGKEWNATTSTYDFEARQMAPAFHRFTSMDPLCEKYYSISPYAYCANNPVNLVDPEGIEIRGVSRRDAQNVVDDLRSMFQGDLFAPFRSLIVQSGRHHNGRSLAKISQDALSSALSGIELSEDQQALIEIIFNTINSEDIHTVEYTSGEGVASPQAKAAFLPGFLSGQLGPFMKEIIDANGGLPLSILSNEGGGGVTTPTKTGTYSIIFTEGHTNGRNVTTGHEILGHGRSLALGLYNLNDPDGIQQHVNAIQTENLILRVIGIPVVNDGRNHGPRRVIPNATDLPSFR